MREGREMRVSPRARIRRWLGFEELGEKDGAGDTSMVRENLGDCLVEVEGSFEDNESKSCFSGEFPDSIIVMSV